MSKRPVASLMPAWLDVKGFSARRFVIWYSSLELLVSTASWALCASLPAQARLSRLAYLLTRLWISEYSANGVGLFLSFALLISCLIILRLFISFHVSSVIHSFAWFLRFSPNMFSPLSSITFLIMVQCSEGLSSFIYTCSRFSLSSSSNFFLVSPRVNFPMLNFFRVIRWLDILLIASFSVIWATTKWWLLATSGPL